MALKVMTYSNHFFTCSNSSITTSCSNTPLPHFATPLPASIPPNKLALNIPNSISTNLPSRSFVLFLVISAMPFISKVYYSRDFAIFIISFISSFRIINVVMPDPKKPFLNSWTCC